MNKRIRKYVLQEKIERISNDLKNNYKMNIAKEFKTRQAFFLLRNSFFKPVSGTEYANAIGDEIFTDFGAWMRDGF